MKDTFIKKIIEKDFEALTLEELAVMMNYDAVFSLSKKDKKILEKAISNNSFDSNKEKIVTVIKEGLPNTFAILSALDKHSIEAGAIKINYREALLNNLNQMNHLQLCIFIDKILMVSKEFKIRFFRNEEYSLHAVNSVISKSLGLTLVFEIFKPGKYKTFMNIDYDYIDKNQMIETLDTQLVRYMYVLEIISEVVLDTEKSKLTGTKINKVIEEKTALYIKIIKKEREKVRKSGMVSKQSWTYTIGGLTDITVEDEDEFFGEEDYE